MKVLVAVKRVVDYNVKVQDVYKRQACVSPRASAMFRIVTPSTPREAKRLFAAAMKSSRFLDPGMSAPLLCLWLCVKPFRVLFGRKGFFTD